MYEQKPSEKELAKVVEALERGGVIIYPTDSVYAFGCSLRDPRAIERMRRIKGKDATTFSMVCATISQISEYCRVDDCAFKTLKRNLPGAFTFLLNALSLMPDKALEKRKTIGVRVPGNAIPRAIVERLGSPLLTTSVLSDDEAEYETDAGLIAERYGQEVSLVIDGGIGDTIPTTVVDLTDDEPIVLREGRGELQ